MNLMKPETRALFKRMATAGAFTMLAVRCVVIFSADFYFFPGHADWKRAFLADSFFIANLHWLVGLSVAGGILLLTKNPFSLPEKTVPDQANGNDVAKITIGMSGGIFWLCFGFCVYSSVIQGHGVRAAAERGNLPELVFYTRLVPESLQYRYPGGQVSDCGPFGFIREMKQRPSRKFGPSLLHLAAQSGNPALVQYLLNQGLSVNDRDNYGQTPLHYAVNINFRFGEATVRLLLEHGADVEARDGQGRTPLFSTVFSSRCLEYSRLLLEHGARPTVSDRDGRTPLHDAVKGSNLELIVLLLDFGADPCATNEKGVRPLDLICDKAVHRMFETRGFEPPPFQQYPWK